MALSYEIHWEVRDTGNDNNGGGFDLAIGLTHTDYSQQDAAQLGLADLACLAPGVIITSVAGGFTAAMIGNVVQIVSGINFVPGFYMLVLVASPNSASLDRSPCPVANGSSGVINVGGGLATMQNHSLQGRWYVKKNAGGPYAFGAGAAASEVRWIGYDTSHTAEPTGANRPTVALTTNNWRTGLSTLIANFVIENTTSFYLYLASRSLIANCEITVKAAYTAQTILRADDYCSVFDCHIRQESSNRPARFINMTLHSRHYFSFWEDMDYTAVTNGLALGTGAMMAYNVVARPQDEALDIDRDDQMAMNLTIYDAPSVTPLQPDPDISDIGEMSHNIYANVTARYTGRWLGRTHKENLYGTPESPVQNEELAGQPASFYFRFPEFVDEDNNDFSLQVPSYFDVGEVQILGV